MGRMPESFVTAAAVAASLGPIVAILGVAFAAVQSYLRTPNLAFGDGVALSLVVSAAVYSATGSFLITIAVAVLAGVGAALAVEFVVLRPLRGRPDPMAPLIATIGAALVLRNLALAPFGADDHAFPQLLGSGRIVVGTTSLDATAIGAAAILGAVALLATLIFRGRWGRALVALRDSPTGARLTGIPAARLTAALAVAAGLLGTLGGILYGAHIRAVGAELGWEVTLLAFSAAIIGGGSLPGAAIGGIALGGLSAITGVLIGSSWADAWALVLLIAVVLARPVGFRASSTPQRI